MVTGNGQRVLAIVQARGDSKGIPRKNLRDLCGHPLVAYSIAAGLVARSVDRLIVSTDAPEIAEVSRSYGAEVPFLRPKELAKDDSPDLPLFEHALNWLKDNEGYRPDLLVQLRPTSPLRPLGLIDEAVQKLLSSPQADCLRAVAVAQQNPYKMWRTDQTGLLRPLLTEDFTEPYNMPRQNLPVVYWQTGHVDIVRYQTIVAKKSLTGDSVASLIIDQNYCVDIDNETDWAYAEWLLSNRLVTAPIPELNDGSGARPCRFPLPAGNILLVLDFDGVLTDNRVLVSADGIETVICDRGDGEGLAMLRAQHVDAVVLSREVNPVVGVRAQKLGLEYRQGVENKEACLRALVAERNLELANVIYVGNDLNDLDCVKLVGLGVAVADSHPEMLKAADWILSKPGGRGAVRELCELIVKAVHERDNKHGA